MNTVVRRARLEDATTFAAIGARIFPLGCPLSTPQADLDAFIGSELTPAKFVEHLQNPGRSLFAGDVAGKTAGYMILSNGHHPEAVTAHRPLELLRLHVLREHHGRGIAAALMQEAFEQTRSGQHGALWLSVSKLNPRGLAFYRKHGFVIVGEQNFIVGSDIHEDFLMSVSP